MKLAHGLVVVAAVLMTTGTSVAASQSTPRSSHRTTMQSAIPEETGSVGMQAPSQRSTGLGTQHQTCHFNGEEAGNRNPDNVVCWK
jgi:hypothetical protein